MKPAIASNVRNIAICLLAAELFLPRAAFADDPPAKPPAQVEAETQTAIYTAKKAKAEAETAAANAKVGSLSTYSETGGIDVTTGSGKLETTLMYSEAARAMGRRIAKSALKGNCQSGATLLVIGSAEHIAFDAYDAFEAQVTSIKKQLDSAINEPLPAPKPPTEAAVSAATSLAAAGTLLNVVGNLFRSDYKLSGIDLTVEDTLLIAAVVEASKDKDIDVPCRIIAPAVYLSKSVDDKNKAVTDLSDLGDVRENANLQLSKDTDAVTTLQKQAAGKKGTEAGKLNAEAVRYTKRIADLTAAIKRYDDFQMKLGTADDKGVVPMAVVARQAKLQELLSNNGLLLSVKANFGGGSQYAKKNFWTFLGSMPFYVSGGGVASYELVKGADGSLVASGVLAQSEPFMKIHKATQRYVNGNPVLIDQTTAQAAQSPK